MNFGIIKMHRNEYEENGIAVRDYYVTFLGIPIYSARFTSTNIDAIIKLTARKQSNTHVCGFAINK